jgi:hypothetical protein
MQPFDAAMFADALLAEDTRLVHTAEETEEE